jgi:hypothetical protein
MVEGGSKFKQSQKKTNKEIKVKSKKQVKAELLYCDLMR